MIHSINDKIKWLNKCKKIDCRKQVCDTCVARFECCRLRHIEKYK